jgi:hypothetical protein
LSVRELGFQLLPDLHGTHASASLDVAHEVIDDSSARAARDLATATPAAATSSEYTSDGTIAGSMDRLRHALNHLSTVNACTAKLVETATARLFNLEHHSPARLLAPTVERHLAMVTGLLTAARHEGVRRSLMISAGQSTLLAGWLSFDRGDMQAANQFWDAAIGAAEGTGDADLLAGGLVWQSYAASRRGDPGSAWQLAYTASEHTPDDPRATAWATARVALCAALLGEHGASREAMRLSLEIGGDLPRPRPGDGGTPWTRSFDRARLMASIGHTAALLDDPYAADYAVQAVDALNTAKVKTHAMVLAEAALTAAIIGELQLCLDYGSRAAVLTREMEVSTAADLLHEVIPIVLPYSDTRPVRKLLPQLTQLTRTADLHDDEEG